MPSSSNNTFSGFQLSSVLQVENDNGTTGYEWSFNVPVRATLIRNFKHLDKDNPKPGFNTFKFTTGCPNKAIHVMTFHFYGKTLAVDYRLENMTFCHYRAVMTAVHSGELQTLQKGLEYGKFPFGSAMTRTDDNVPDPEEPKEKTYQKSWYSIVPLNQDVWHDPVDEVKITIFLDYNSDSTPPKKEACLAINTKKYFLSNTLSDVTIVDSDGHEMPAHRFLLSGRSPVFEKMFEHGMKEATEGRIQIDDIDPGVLKETLHFIYSGEFLESTVLETMPVDLLKAADKYELKDLRSICVRKILQTIDIDNALEYYAVGDMFHESVIMDKAVEMMKINKVRAITDSPEVLAQIAKQYPQLAMILFKN